MELRAATLSDAPAMAELHRSCFDVPWSVDTFTTFLATEQAFVLGKPIQAFIMVRTSVDEAEILTLAVAQQWQRHGLATRLLAHILAALAQHSVRRIFLEVACDNHAACALYSKIGFLQVGVRQEYYIRPNGHAMDAKILSYVLDDTNDVKKLDESDHNSHRIQYDGWKQNGRSH
ncbi:ribosomal protein S18-alanine N-acetyltransferase [Candidatus Phycosocius spiralis]|uniref:Alanine acetyltransferase n=1 Tax=Candidatus Phycosocius spiralis TaxID=2815099 RepID=A0ABQ4PVH1_9PROT|nr:ribosomal protein S18-alanine N-acetyltransferase [Candidatus Phycosocius spiralis]GIU67016.1 alanine acetyltransferase [Candidatus Phycosocius spiralis]